MMASLSRRMRILVIGSLALNIFGIGAIAANAVIDGHSHCRPPRFMGLPSSRELREVLPENDQAMLEELLQANRAGFRERLNELLAAKQRVADAIKAEPFDRARLDIAFAALRERHAAMTTGAQGWLTEFVARLDPEGRARIAELLTRRHGRRDKGAD